MFCFFSVASVHIHPRCSVGGDEAWAYENTPSRYPLQLQDPASSRSTHKTNQTGDGIRGIYTSLSFENIATLIFVPLGFEYAGECKEVAVPSC